MRFKTLKLVFSTIMILTFAFSTPVKSYAKDIQLTTSEIFNETELNEISNRVQKEKIYVDNKSMNSFQKSSTTNVVAASTGTYPTRPGVILVTSDKFKGLIPTGHAAIIWTSTTVVESLSNGVTTGPNDWNTSKGTCYGITVSGTTAAQDNAASNWCYKQIGKPYNYNYLNKTTREKFYCSQLIYAAYLDNYNINIDTSAFITAVHPMELVDSANTYTIYVK